MFSKLTFYDYLLVKRQNIELFLTYLDGGEEDALLALSVHRRWRQQLQGLGGQEQRQSHQSRGGDQQGRGGRGQDEQRTWS